MINWNGTSSDDLHLYVEKYPDQLKPAKKINIVSVPGRNGDLIFEEDAYENVIQSYDVYISAETPKLPAAAKAVASWLYAPKGYARLQDDYDTDTFRLAHYSGQTNIENVFNRFGRATLEFNCKPQRFLTSGELITTLTSAGNIVNPTAFESLPLIKITGDGRINLNIGGQVIIIDIDDEDITLDSETQNAYKGTVNLNNKVAGAYPKLVGGTNAISWEGDVTKIEITPRWWTL